MSIRYRAADGTETICAGLTPGGDIEAGAVMTRKGNFTVPRTSPDTTSFVSVTFSEAMPDSDYEVNLYSPADSDSGIRTFELTVYNRTTTGFKVAATRTVSTANDPVNFSYTAWKIYSVQHAAQNAEDIANIKAIIPSTASSTNKLATSNDVSSLNTSLGSRLDDVEDVIDATASITNKLVSQSTMQTAIDNVEIDVDDEIDATSENPVQNKVIKAALDNKENKQFTGTQAEWNALTEAQKKSYRIANITDDTDYVGNIVDTVADGNMSAVTSNAVFDKLNNKFRDFQVFYSPRDYYSIQQDFTWTNAKVQALVDDMITAFGNNIQRGFCQIVNGITFVGTYMYNHDSSYTHISLDIQSYDQDARYHIVINPGDGITIRKIASITYVDITAAAQATGYANYPAGYDFNNTVIVAVMHNNGSSEKVLAPYAGIETNVGLHTDAIFLWNRGDSERTVRVYITQV